MKRVGLLFVVILMVTTACSANTNTTTVTQDQNGGTSSGFNVTPTGRVGTSVGDTVPNLSIYDLEGNKHNLSDYRGQFVLFSMWATWCPSCRKEMPSMQKLYDELKDKGFVILAYAADPRESVEAVKEALKADFAYVTFPVFSSAINKEAKDRMFRFGFPTNYLIDENGVIMQVFIGAVDWQGSVRIWIMRTMGLSVNEGTIND